MLARVFRFISPVIAVVLISATAAPSQTKRIVVKFKPGTSGATYNNSVTGYGTVDFAFRASAGQTLAAKLTTSNSSLYFVISKSGATDSVNDSARDATEWSGELPETGEYVVRVYLFRNAARRTKSPVKFSLRLDIN